MTPDRKAIPTLFPTDGPTGAYGQPGEVTPTHRAVHPDAIPRLGGQNKAILDRLKRDRATNSELADMALNYRARVSDLRKHGCTIVVEDEDHRTGLAWYRLVHCPETLS
jgi:hypothetical protein